MLAGVHVEFENTYTNAVLFRSKLRKEPNLDSLFVQEPFLATAIRFLRQDSSGVEALSIPRPGASENYYLIRGDSITQLLVNPRKVR